MGTQHEAVSPPAFLWLQGSSSLGIGLKRPVRNAHRWRLEICFINVDRLTSCLLTFARPVETSAPPQVNLLMVEVGGIEPPSETLLVRRNYDYVCIIGVQRENLK